MEIEKNYATYKQFTIKHTIGQGAQGKVKLATDGSNLVALKFLKTFNSDVQKEIEIHRILKHQNLVQLLEFHSDGDYIKKDGTIIKRPCLVYNYVQGGELFEYLAQTGRFSEEISRYFFSQLIQVLLYMHGKGVAHRDLKPENILFEDGILKVTDLGFTTLVGGKTGEGFLKTFKGTKGYMAPEVMSKQTYNGQSVDIFAIGVILYVMLTGQLPFSQAFPKDQVYNLICTNRQDQFWFLKEKQLKMSFSNDLKQLLNSLLAFDPLQRVTLSEILASPWLNGAMASQEQVVEVLRSRKNKIDAQLTVERLKKQIAKTQDNKSPLTYGIGKFNRGEQNDINEDDVERKLKGYKYTRLKLPIEGKELFQLLIENYKQFANQVVKISKTKYQLNYYYLGENGEEFEIQIQLVDAGEQLVGLAFQCINGSGIENHQKIIQIEDYFMNLILLEQ